MCLRVPDIPESLESTENTISYRIVVEGTQSPVYRNGTPVRVILRVRRTDSSVSEREGKGEKQHKKVSQFYERKAHIETRIKLS